TDELIAIAERFARASEYRFGEGVDGALRSIFEGAARGEGFGNARFARTIFEQALNTQALRLAGRSDVGVEELTTLEADDALAARLSRCGRRRHRGRLRVGGRLGLRGRLGRGGRVAGDDAGELGRIDPAALDDDRADVLARRAALAHGLGELLGRDQAEAKEQALERQPRR